VEGERQCRALGRNRDYEERAGHVSEKEEGGRTGGNIGILNLTGGKEIVSKECGVPKAQPTGRMARRGLILGCSERATAR